MPSVLVKPADPIRLPEAEIRRLARENAKCWCIGCARLFLTGHMRWTFDGLFVCAECACAGGYTDDDVKPAIWIDHWETELVRG